LHGQTMGQSSAVVNSFRYFFSLFFRWPGGARLAQNLLGGGCLIAHYIQHEPCQARGVGVNPPRFFEIFLLDISVIQVGGGFLQSLNPFIPILYIP
jgi:hypothetical protein